MQIRYVQSYGGTKNSTFAIKITNEDENVDDIFTLDEEETYIIPEKQHIKNMIFFEKRLSYTHARSQSGKASCLSTKY